MNNIIKKIEKNKEIQKLLGEFKTDFSINYENSNDIEEFILNNYRDTIFRKWLFSPIVQETYLTPYYIINDIAQNIQKGDYSIAPHINILIENNEVSFTTKWIEYSRDKSPVLEDLDILVKYCNPTLIQRKEAKYVIDNGEKFIDEINFRSGYYIEYLINLALKLDIIKEVKAIGCKCYQLSEGYNEYEKLNNTERINKIILESIDISNKKLKEGCNINNDSIAMEILDNSINSDEYNKYMIEIIRYYEDMTNNINELDVDEEEIRAIRDIEGLLEKNVANIMAISDFGVFFDINFTNIFGYYLGIVNPIYDGLFFVKVFNKVVSKLIQDEDIINAIFTLELGHDLTALGEVLLSEVKSNFREKMFKSANSKMIKEAIDYYLYTKQEMLEENLDMFDDNWDEDDEDEMLNELFGENMPRAIIEHLTEFYDYLFMNKKLKEKTANKHCENVEFYLRFYLNIKDLLSLDKITKDSIHMFMIDWFIPKIATSKSNVKEELTSLSQYVKFLTDKGLVEKSLLKEFKDISKNKDNYIDYFEEYMEEEWDLF